jgi:hypothetical protein
MDKSIRKIVVWIIRFPSLYDMSISECGRVGQKPPACDPVRREVFIENIGTGSGGDGQGRLRVPSQGAPVLHPLGTKGHRGKGARLWSLPPC